MISAIILTKNEEKNIEECLKALVWCDEIIVIDDASEDKTGEIAKKHGAKVISRALENDFAAQRNFGIEKAKGEWTFFVDADERVTSSLRDEIIQYTNNPINKFHGAFISRQDIIWGRQLRHGENGNSKIIRLAKKGTGKWVGKVHEVWQVSGKITMLHTPLFHYPHPTIADFLSEINFYSSLRAQELFSQKVQVNWWNIILYSKAKFLQDYIFRLGFLDGIPGFVSAIMMSFHSFLVRSKLWMLQSKTK